MSDCEDGMCCDQTKRRIPSVRRIDKGAADLIVSSDDYANLRRRIAALEAEVERLTERGDAMAPFVVICDRVNDLRIWQCQACWQRADHPASIVHYKDCALYQWRAALAASSAGRSDGDGAAGEGRHVGAEQE